jgi:phospholipase/carboxylesterase
LVDAGERELPPAAPLFLGGFSPGAMPAPDVVLRSERPFSGLIILSGMPIAEAEWTPRLGARRGLPVFQSHGRADPILPYPTAELLRDRLEAAGLEVDFHAFAGGHGIPRDVLQKLGAFLRRHEGKDP